jgi:hypothetical protein
MAGDKKSTTNPEQANTQAKGRRAKVESFRR